MSNIVMLSAVMLIATGSEHTKHETATEREVRAAIIEGFEYSNKHKESKPDTYSKHGALEFWSSGGLLHEVTDRDSGGFDWVRLQPKHIRVVTLVEGQAAVAHYYSEGSFKPKKSAAVPHYLTRVSEVYVKEDGKWKIRSAHWSPLTGGSGTSQAAQATDD